MIYFQDTSREIGQAIISVKGGTNIHATHIRDLIGAMRNTAFKLGVFVTLHPPTSAMVVAAREAEAVEAGGKLRPRVQICTIADLLRGQKPTLPPVHDIISAAASARRIAQRRAETEPTPAEIRQSPSFRFPIQGGRKGDAQRTLSLDEPLLTTEAEKKAKPRRRA